MRPMTIISFAAGLFLTASSGSAADYCASADQVLQVQDYYAEAPGAMPPIASMRTGLTEAIVVSGLPAGRSVSAAGKHFAEVWDAMGSWGESTFLIMKGQNVFEIRSTVGKGAPSETSDYFNIAYDQPVRGHLRPDLYASIYAIEMPGRGDAIVRGVLFYGEDGASEFGVFVSGDSVDPTEDDITNFNKVKDLIASKGSVCPPR